MKPEDGSEQVPQKCENVGNCALLSKASHAVNVGNCTLEQGITCCKCW